MPEDHPDLPSDPLWSDEPAAPPRSTQPSVDLQGDSIWTTSTPASSSSDSTDRPSSQQYEGGGGLPRYGGGTGEGGDPEPVDPFEASSASTEPPDDGESFEADDEDYFDDDPRALGNVPRYPGGGDGASGSGFSRGRSSNLIIAAVIVAAAIIVAVVIGTRHHSKSSATAGGGNGAAVCNPSWPDVSALPTGWTNRTKGDPAWQVPPAAQPGLYIWSDFNGWHVVGVNLLTQATVSVRGDNTKPDDLTARPETGSTGVTTARDSDSQWTITLPAGKGGQGANLTVGHVGRITIDAQANGQPFDPTKIHEGFSTLASSLPIVLVKPQHC